MKLKKIYFDSYKSLLNKELEIDSNCVGLVGINESGKSNLLSAISVLSGNKKLTTQDTPKIEDEKYDPALRFDFDLSDDERTAAYNIILDWAENNSLLGREFPESRFNVTYHVTYDRKQDIEKRFFSLNNFEIDEAYSFLLNQYLNDSYKLMANEEFIPLAKAIILSDSHLKDDAKREQINNDISNLDKEMESIELFINNASIERAEAESSDLSEDEIEANGSEIKQLLNMSEEMEAAISEHREKLEELKTRREKLVPEGYEINSEAAIEALKSEIANSKSLLEDYNTQAINVAQEQDQLKQLEPLEEEQKKLNTSYSRKITTLTNKMSQLQVQILAKEQQIKILAIPLRNKYTKDISVLDNYLSPQLEELLNEKLPKVVFWKHEDSYILASETAFKDILNQDSLDSISRPLVNIFRIGLDIEDIDDLHKKIVKIQNDSNARSKLEKKLNTNVNKYIKDVWKEYDQELNISLEKDIVRIEVFDPKYDDHNYYYMEERSQGAKTFLSFLLTIGAEAKQSVIKNTILLLDEPETHLHPSGVRFLLQELIKISENGNVVVYATHSIFMINNQNYNQHVILKKVDEQTNIKPSSRNRVGYFMQEEVLYAAFDVELGSEIEIPSLNKFNFVFEGDGDAKIFEHYYSNIINDCPFPSDKTSFHHGGGCGNIMEYLKRRPIQLGSTWVFVLDADGPANKLKAFIESIYKKYIGTDIFIFQYEADPATSGDTELEDLLPNKLLLEAYEQATESLSSEFSSSTISGLLQKDETFSERNKSIYSTLNTKIDLSGFKKIFKKFLNQVIGEKTSQAKDQKSFSELFPSYSNWASNQIEALNKQLSDIEGNKKQPNKKKSKKSSGVSTEQ